MGIHKNPAMDSTTAPFGLAVIAAATTAAFSSLLRPREFLPYDDEPNFVHESVKGWRSDSFEEQVRWALTTTRGHVFIHKIYIDLKYTNQSAIAC